MTLEDVKRNIQKDNLAETFLIFVCHDNFFIAEQYIRELAHRHPYTIEYIDSLDRYKGSQENLFEPLTDTVLHVLTCNKFSSTDFSVCSDDNLIVITHEISDEVWSIFENNIVEVPKLEAWQIEDYIFSLAEGADSSDLERLCKLCAGDIYKIENEVSKLSIFPEIQRKYLLKELFDSDSLQGKSDLNIFTLTNALQCRNVEDARKVLLEISNIDVEPLGLITIMHQNLRKMILVWLSANPTPENTGLKGNQIWAIRNLPRVFTREQLLRAFQLVNSLEYKLKSGEINEDLIIDYMVIKILSLE